MSSFTCLRCSCKGKVNSEKIVSSTSTITATTTGCDCDCVCCNSGADCVYCNIDQCKDCKKPYVLHILEHMSEEGDAQEETQVYLCDTACNLWIRSNSADTLLKQKIIPSQVSQYECTFLYLGDIDPNVDESTLLDFFNPIRPVASIRLCRDRITRQSLRYGYVNFHSARDAEHVLNTLSISEINARPYRLLRRQLSGEPLLSADSMVSEIGLQPMPNINCGGENKLPETMNSSPQQLSSSHGEEQVGSRDRVRDSTLMQHAIVRGDVDLVWELLQAGANPFTTDASNLSPVDLVHSLVPFYNCVSSPTTPQDNIKLIYKILPKLNSSSSPPVSGSSLRLQLPEDSLPPPDMTRSQSDQIAHYSYSNTKQLNAKLESKPLSNFDPLSSLPLMLRSISLDTGGQLSDFSARGGAVRENLRSNNQHLRHRLRLAQGKQKFTSQALEKIGNADCPTNSSVSVSDVAAAQKWTSAELNNMIVKQTEVLPSLYPRRSVAMMNTSPVKTDYRVTSPSKNTSSLSMPLRECSACLDGLPDDELAYCCSRLGCQGSLCQMCLFRSVFVTITSALYAVPTIRCPGCLSRIPTALWRGGLSGMPVGAVTPEDASALSLKKQEVDAGSPQDRQLLRLNERLYETFQDFMDAYCHNEEDEEEEEEEEEESDNDEKEDDGEVLRENSRGGGDVGPPSAVWPGNDEVSHSSASSRRRISSPLHRCFRAIQDIYDFQFQLMNTAAPENTPVTFQDIYSTAFSLGIISGSVVSGVPLKTFRHFSELVYPGKVVEDDDVDEYVGDMEAKIDLMLDIGEGVNENNLEGNNFTHTWELTKSTLCNFLADLAVMLRSGGKIDVVADFENGDGTLRPLDLDAMSDESESDSEEEEEEDEEEEQEGKNEMDKKDNGNHNSSDSGCWIKHDFHIDKEIELSLSKTSHCTDIEKLLIDKYVSNAKALLMLRCGGCDETSSLFRTKNKKNQSTYCVVLAPENRQKLLSQLHRGISDTASFNFLKSWHIFCNGGPPKPFICLLIDTYMEQMSGRGLSFLHEEQNLLRSGVCSGSTLKYIQVALSLLLDVERRFTAHLELLRQYPKIVTDCCECEHCFMCKIEGHHEGKTCEQVQSEEMGTECQYCPGCNVPTLRSEGCSEILCVCGAVWEWESHSDDEDDRVRPGAWRNTSETESDSESDSSDSDREGDYIVGRSRRVVPRQPSRSFWLRSNSDSSSYDDDDDE